jgi:DtxR family transcriptional regulator, Mn-dependent transcriptional regulator
MPGPTETDKPSPSVQDYVRAIYDLERTSGAPVATTMLADRLSVAAASVTGMVKRLHRDGYVRHERYAGVELTPSGRQVALEVIRHHRLIETYLASAMGVSWDKVHDEAHRLEHHISEELEDRMAEILGHPDQDPHGAAIPPKDGPFEEPTYQTLADVAAGETVVVTEVEDEDPELLRYLDSLGLRPGATLEVLEIAPFAGPLTLLVASSGGGADEPVAVGRDLAATVSVSRVG